MRRVQTFIIQRFDFFPDSSISKLKKNYISTAKEQIQTNIQIYENNRNCNSIRSLKTGNEKIKNNNKKQKTN